MERKNLRNRQIWLLAMEVLTAFALRAPLSAVGTLAGPIKQEYALGSGALGFLTTLPLVAFGAMAAIGIFRARNDYGKWLPYCLGVMLLGGAVRSFGGRIGLYLGTVMIGAGIGILNVGMPVLIKQQGGAKAGWCLGLYTASMTLMSAVSSGVSALIYANTRDWKLTLAVFAGFPLLALILWPKVKNELRGQETVRENKERLRFSSGAKATAVIMAAQAVVFYSLLSWLPSIASSRGISSVAAGGLLSVMQISCLPSNAFTPIIMGRSHNKARPLYFAAVIYLISFGLLALSSQGWMFVLASVMLGIANGISFSGALTLVTLIGKGPEATARLSAYANAAGYFLAAAAPTLIGVAYDAAGSWSWPIGILVIDAAVLAISAGIAGRALQESK